MLTGLSENLRQINDSRKTAVINDELKRLNVDIATLQETRLADSGSLKENDYTFYWQGKSSNEPREHGVGFAVRNTLLSMIEPGSISSERLLTLRLNTNAGSVTLVSVYAPTLTSTPNAKDEFYESLATTISSIPSKEQLILLGDFNARVCADHDSWPSCLGQFGVGRMNENGQRLLELCTFHNLCIANSFFKTKLQHKVSWRHPCSKHWHQLDLILVRRSAIKNVLHTRTYHSADCDTPWSAARLGCSQRSSTATRSKGIPALTPARCVSQTLWSSLQWTLRESWQPRSPETLPQRSGRPCGTPCTAPHWPPLGGRPRSLRTGLKQSLSR